MWLRKGGTTGLAPVYRSFEKMQANAPVIVLSIISSWYMAGSDAICFIDTNTQRESGRKVQMGNIEIAKVTNYFFRSFLPDFIVCRLLAMLLEPA